MIVAIGIFTVIIVIYVGMYSRFLATQRQSGQIQIVLEQVRSSLELMNREIRTGFGSTYQVADNRGRGVVFRNQDGNCIEYRWLLGKFERADIGASTSCTPNDLEDANYSSLVGSDVNITNMRFDAVPATEAGGSLQTQGFVTIIVSATNRDETIVPTVFQSSVTSRQVIPYVQE